MQGSAPSPSLDSLAPSPYLSGEALYGDNLSLHEIKAWYADESEGYAGLVAEREQPYEYGYHALNRYHGFRHLPDRPFEHALGFGSAFGDEFQPLASRIKRLTIVDPSDAFVRGEVHGIPATYVKPSVEGTLPFATGTFDLITSLGVLHHIPNVSHVTRELYRCLQPGGFLLLREPIISMGDWSRPRAGLTKHERGIPLPYFRALLRNTGFRVEHEGVCMFPLSSKLWVLTRRSPYNHLATTWLDHTLARLTRWNWSYHPQSALGKLRPTNVFWVLRKP